MEKIFENEVKFNEDHFIGELKSYAIQSLENTKKEIIAFWEENVPSSANFLPKILCVPKANMLHIYALFLQEEDAYVKKEFVFPLPKKAVYMELPPWVKTKGGFHCSWAFKSDAMKLISSYAAAICSEE